MAASALTYWIPLVARLVEENLTVVLEQYGVSRTQWLILRALVSGPTSAVDLANSIEAMPANPFGESGPSELSELVASGWVTAGEHYSITDRGAAAYDRLADSVDEMRETMVDGVSDEDQAHMVVTLERFSRNLGWTR
ncbi:MAG TPA: MarR family transcriptional regulator [Pseudolysinimonas sp.]|nr:MarR family transcriptional regulator [Pseudolysinimonas sp.]